ncbi:MAG: ABC transporter permease [Eubacteriales bacterium]|nr:ABC transporter permease [Eubacteriales bacterium]
MQINLKSDGQAIKPKKTFTEIAKKYFSYAFLMVMFVVFTLLNSTFIKPSNLVNILEQSTVILTMGMGATFVIISGSIDLSVGSVLGLSSAVMVATVNAWGWVGIIIGMLVGAVCGLINGILYAETKIPSFIATLGMMVSLRGVVYIITNGIVFILEGPIRQIGINKIIPYVPNIFIGFIVVLAVTYILFNYTVFGRNARAIGGNEEVAMLSGINLKKNKILIYLLSGLTSGIAGVFAAIRLGAAAPALGNGYELDVIAAIVLGGTLLSGGIGRLLGTLIGGLIMGTLANGMNMAGISAYYQQFIRGLVVIIAVVLTIDRKNIKFVK